MKRGLLYTNRFLSSAHFDALYALIEQAAAGLGIAFSRVSGDVTVLPEEKHPAREADFVLFWDKDIAEARRIARMGTPVFNSADAIRVCDSKTETAEALLSAGLPVPKTLYAPMTYESIGYTDTSFVKTACQNLGFPIVIKESYGSFGEQVYLAKTVDEAEATVASIGAKPFLFQEFIASSFGRDVRVNVVGDSAVCAMERVGRTGDFRSNIAGGGVGSPYPLSPEEAELAVKAARAVGADFAGVDLLFGDTGMLVCEVNSNPHFTGTYKHTGINLALPILEHILKTV